MLLQIHANVSILTSELNVIALTLGATIPVVGAFLLFEYLLQKEKSTWQTYSA